MSVQNIGASIRNRLLNKARAENLDFNLLLTRYALERMLYRLSISEQRDQFLLKGALLFDLWFDVPHRPTHDADLLGFGSPEISHLEEVFRNISRIEVENALARQATEGQQTKTEMIYQYLTGPRFRQRVEAIVEAFSTMQEDLDKERKVIMKQWAKREEQIERVMGATVGMYGDLQGIAGKPLQEIEGLSLQALDAPVVNNRSAAE